MPSTFLRQRRDLISGYGTAGNGSVSDVDGVRSRVGIPRLRPGNVSAGCNLCRHHSRKTPDSHSYCLWVEFALSPVLYNVVSLAKPRTPLLCRTSTARDSRFSLRCLSRLLKTRRQLKRSTTLWKTSICASDPGAAVFVIEIVALPCAVTFPTQ